MGKISSCMGGGIPLMDRGNFWEKPGSMGVEMRDGFLYDSIIRFCLPTEQEVYFSI
jgi:hypothetical protein